MIRTLSAGVLALALLIAAPAIAQPKFPALSGRVVDGANILAPATEAKLDADLATLETSTGRQLVVATVADLQGYEIEDYGYQLGRAWKLGREGEDDGAILLVAPSDRKVRIEVGYGLESVLTDALSSQILQSAVLPQFREGRMEQGVVDGTAALITQLTLPDGEARANVAKAAAQPAQAGDGAGLSFGTIVMVLFVLFVLSRVFRGRRRRRSGLGWIVPMIAASSGRGGGFGGFGGGGGGFSGGGGSFGGGGSSGSW